MLCDEISGKSNEPIEKGAGVTKAERYLGMLCNRTFLSLWSYPCIHRDEGGSKEVCDLLVVFKNHIIIFSDKDYTFPDTGNTVDDWNRWYRKAIKDSAKQIWGAERWIRAHPDRLFIDSKCSQRFPIEMPNPATAKFHRIVVAHSSAKRCRQEMKGGSGSLMIASNIIGDMHYAGKPNNGKPFWIGQVDPSKGFIHVFDDASLDIVMKSLDTVSDFIMYLEKKESFLSRKETIFAAGEEDLLAFYLEHLNESGEHDFVIPKDSKGIFICPGEWDEFTRHPQRKAQLEENVISYYWDDLIERFSQHILADTQYFASPGGVASGEKVMRIMASENRFQRRVLSAGFLGFMSKPVEAGNRAVRIFPPSLPEDPCYILLLLPRRYDTSDDKYREERRTLLEACCITAKLRCPEAEDIVGIATEPGNNEEMSEDALCLDARNWTENDQQNAVNLQNDLGLLKNLKMHHYEDSEYPSLPKLPDDPIILMKGRNRNQPCPCGSGLKFKKCCGTG